MSDKSIRLAVVGLGRIGLQHIRTCAKTDGLELAAVCDTDENQLTKAQEEANVKGYSSYDDLLADGHFDWLVIGTPSHLHMDMTLAGLQAGYHVMVEKPMADDAQQAERMIETAKECGNYLTVNQSLRYQEDSCLVKRILDSGRIGVPYCIYRGEAGFSERTDWQIWKKYNGGALANLGVHLIDIVLQLSNQAPKEVFADFHQIQDQGDVEDSFSIMIRFEDGSTAQTEVLKAGCGKGMWHVCGSRGTIYIPSSSSTVVDVRVYSGKKLEQTESIDFCTEAGNKIGRHYRDFARRLLNDEPPPITPQSVLLQMKIVDAARKSAETGRSVSV